MLCLYFSVFIIPSLSLRLTAHWIPKVHCISSGLHYEAYVSPSADGIINSLRSIYLDCRTHQHLSLPPICSLYLSPCMFCAFLSFPHATYSSLSWNTAICPASPVRYKPLISYTGESQQVWLMQYEGRRGSPHSSLHLLESMVLGHVGRWNKK